MSGPNSDSEESAPKQVLSLLPGDGNSPARALGFDRELDGAAAPPLPFPDGSFDLIWSLSAFSRMEVGWADWLLELRRLLGDQGVLVAGLAERPTFERLTGIAWDESRIGMTVLAATNGEPRPVVFHSEWWLRAHWGRAFDLVALEERDGRPFAVLRGRAASLSSADLERPGPGDERELAAASANVFYLRAQLEGLARRQRGELEEQREEMGRELMRRSFAAADLDWARRGPGSPASLVAAEYEATTSWKLTKPLRAIGRALRRDT